MKKHNPTEALVLSLTGTPAQNNETPIIATPRPTYLAGVRDIATTSDTHDVEVVFNDVGEVRSITGSGLFADKFTGNCTDYATKFINSRAAQKALGLRYATLVAGETNEYEAFTRVEFKQVANVKGFASAIPVRGGFVHVFIDKQGDIIQVNSTVRHGRKPTSIGKIITSEKSIELAIAKLGVPSAIADKCTLVLSSHEGSMNAIYEVTLSANEPERRLVMFLVMAKTGEVVYVENKLHFSQKRQPRKPAGDPTLLAGIAASTFLRIPTYNKNEPISKQVSKGIVEGTELKDPKLLANDRYDMKVKKDGKWVTVRANSKGTFEFDPLSKDKYEVSCFSATVAFLWLNTQDATLESWGAVKVPRAIPVYIDDESVTDNAYFDPSAWEIHDGVGSGIENGGLVTHISWDPGVNLHENTHKRNAAEAPGKDLPGEQGMGAGEATSDVYGDLLFDLWMRYKGGATLGHVLTLQDIIDSTGVIGQYCMAPDGIRNQDNHNTYPKDIEHEEHTDGLIVGGAYFDLMRAMAKLPGTTVEDVLRNNGKIYLNGTRLLPAHKVLFTDYLRAYLTVDKSMFGGVYKDMITKAFGDHGIKLGTVIPAKGKKGGKTTGGKKPNRRKVA
ncbi:hypothetical protein BH10CYA1_BH10CYA1_41580 [soil metagenome]